MRIIATCCAIVGLLSGAAHAQTSAGTRSPSADERVSADLQALHQQFREAATRHDQAALERIFADEFVLVHTTGGVDTKAEHIRKTLTATGGDATAPGPAQDQVHMDVYGDVVVRTARARTGDGRYLWWTWVYVKRDGRWQIARQHGTQVPVAAPTITLAPEILDAYVGRYAYTPEAIVTVWREGTTLHAQGTGRAAIILDAESETRFHLQGGGAIYTFYKDDKGQVTHLTLKRESGQEVRANRIQ